MITAHSVTKQYGEYTALENVSFTIHRGEVVGLLGPNGAGKSTLMRIMACFMPATSGYVTIGQHTTDRDTLHIRKKIGYLPENAPLYSEMTVLEYLHFMADMHGLSVAGIMDRTRYVMEVCSLGEKKHQPIGELSKGYRQRVGLAAALIHDPEILILDEPTAGLDPNQMLEIRDLILDIKKEKTIILSTHILSEVEAVCDRVMIINRGRLAAVGSKEEVKSQIPSRTRVLVLVEGSVSGLSVLLQKVEGIGEIMMNRRDDVVTEIIIETISDRDLRRDIIELLTRHKYGFVGIEKHEATLEDVFTKLTIPS